MKKLIATVFLLASMNVHSADIMQLKRMTDMCFKSLELGITTSPVCQETIDYLDDNIDELVETAQKSEDKELHKMILEYSLGTVSLWNEYQ